MNELIKELAFKSGLIQYASDSKIEDVEKFAEAIVKECINTLQFHGFDDAVPYIQWMATNNFGVKF